MRQFTFVSLVESFAAWNSLCHFHFHDHRRQFAGHHFRVTKCSSSNEDQCVDRVVGRVRPVDGCVRDAGGRLSRSVFAQLLAVWFGRLSFVARIRRALLNSVHLESLHDRFGTLFGHKKSNEGTNLL